jgi:hypothetical protein
MARNRAQENLRVTCESPASSLAVICEPLASCLRDLRVLASYLRYLSKTVSLRPMNSLSTPYCLIPLFVTLFRPGGSKQEERKKLN